MNKRELISENLSLRARRSAREIALAVALTLAAIAFGIATLNTADPETAAIDMKAGDSKPN